MTGTVTVTIHRSVFHPLYRKRYRVSKKFLADSAGKDLGVGDTVLISECRPLSKRKRFVVTEIIKSAPRVSEMVEEEAVTATVQESIRKPKNDASDSSSAQ